MRTDRPAVTFDYGSHLVHIYADGTREEEPTPAIANKFGPKPGHSVGGIGGRSLGTNSIVAMLES